MGKVAHSLSELGDLSACSLMRTAGAEEIVASFKRSDMECDGSKHGLTRSRQKLISIRMLGRVPWMSEQRPTNLHRLLDFT